MRYATESSNLKFFFKSTNKMPTVLDTKLPDLLTALQIKVVNRDLYYQDFTHCAMLEVRAVRMCL